jgi:hypothetical protein
MAKLSDEDIISNIWLSGHKGDREMFDYNQTELLSHLSKGQKAIEAMEKISEVRFREGDDYAGKLYDITEIFLQYNKEK